MNYRKISRREKVEELREQKEKKEKKIKKNLNEGREENGPNDIGGYNKLDNLVNQI